MIIEFLFDGKMSATKTNSFFFLFLFRYLLRYFVCLAIAEKKEEEKGEEYQIP